MKIYLDDIRKCPVGWIPAKNYNEFVALIKRAGIPKEVSFDHDLADIHYKNLINGISNENCREKTGYDCAKFLYEHCLEIRSPFPEWQVHSMNPIGKQRIIDLLNDFDDHFRAFHG